MNLTNITTIGSTTTMNITTIGSTTTTNITTIGSTTTTNITTNGSTTTTIGSTPEAEIWVPFAEPVPNYEEAMTTYGIWWDVHVYAVAALFFMVAAYSIFNIIYLLHLRCDKELRSNQQTAFFIAITILMLVFSVERAVFMLIDPYNIRASLHPLLAYLFISIGLPCMTSSFFLIFYAFHKATRSRRARGSILSVKLLISVIVSHFVISVSLDVAAGVNVYPIHLLMICQGLFVFCGVFLAIMFIILFVRMYKQSVTQRRRMIRIASLVDDTLPGIAVSTAVTETKPEITGRSAGSLRSMPQPEVTTGGKLILVSAILLLFISALYLYGMFGIFLYSTLTGTDPGLWMWWGYELSVRITEVCLCWTISLAGTQPAIRNFLKKRSIKRRQSEIQLIERRRSEASLIITTEQPENAPQSKEDKVGIANDALDKEDIEEAVSKERRVSFSTIPSDVSDSTNLLSSGAIRKGSLVPPTTPETILESPPDVSNNNVLGKFDSVDDENFDPNEENAPNETG